MKFTAKITGLISLVLVFTFLTQYADASGRTGRQDGSYGFEGYTGTSEGSDGAASDLLKAQLAVRENNKMYTIYFNDNGTVLFNTSFHSNSYVNLSSLFATTNHATTNASQWQADFIGDLNGDGKKELIMIATNRFGAGGAWKQLQVLFYGDNGTIAASGHPDPEYYWVQDVPVAVGRFLGATDTVPGQTDTDAQQLLVREQNDKLYVINFADNGTVLFNNTVHSNMYSYMSSVLSTNEHATTNVADWQIDIVFDANGDGQDEILARTTNSFGGGSAWRQLQLLFFADNATLLPRASQPSPAYYWKEQSLEASGRFLGTTNTVPGQTSTNAQQVLVREQNDKLYTICFADNGTVLFNNAVHSNMYSTISQFVATTNHISTNPANWVIQAVGDVNNDRKDEILLRCTTTTPNGQWTQAQLLFFSDNGTIRASNQPDPQAVWIQDVIENFTANRQNDPS